MKWKVWRTRVLSLLRFTTSDTPPTDASSALFIEDAFIWLHLDLDTLTAARKTQSLSVFRVSVSNDIPSSTVHIPHFRLSKTRRTILLCSQCLISPIIYYFIHSSMALQPFVGPWPLLQYRNHFYTDGRTPWTSDQPLPTHRTSQTRNKRTHRHTCLEWDSNPRSQRSSERRQFMP
jgi:hypothetical protein